MRSVKRNSVQLGMSRVDVSGMLLRLICIIAVWTLSPVYAGADETSRPNIVLIMADDLGWGDVGFHGGKALTPNLDRLAKEGVELSQHYVAPVCSPTRTGLLTGRYWSRFGVTTPTNTLAIPYSTETLSSLLADAGYDTCLVGKWHLGSLPKWGPNHFGFQHSYGSLAGGVSPWSHGYKEGPYRPTWHRNQTLMEQQGHVTDLLTAEAIDWIGKREENPFFLYLPYTAVHLPLREPDSWLNRVPSGISDQVERHYLASIMHLDDAVGQVLDALADHQKIDRTIVVFTSDNGGSTAENNDLRYPDDGCPNGRLPGRNLPLRGQKGDVYEGGIRVPTVVWGPHFFVPRIESTPVQIVDWLPTLCHFADVDVDLKSNSSLDGSDLHDLLVEQKPLEPRVLYTAGPNWRSRAIRYGRWKLIQHKTSKMPTSELYDLESDPRETNNLAGTQGEILKQMQQRLIDVSSRDRESVVTIDRETGSRVEESKVAP